MENWETGFNLLKLLHFEFPSRLWSFVGAKVNGVPEHPSETGVKSLQSADASVLCPPDQLAPVTRRYQPEPAALEELVDVLYRLLMDVPVDEPVTTPVASEWTCFSIARE